MTEQRTSWLLEYSYVALLLATVSMLIFSITRHDTSNAAILGFLLGVNGSRIMVAVYRVFKAFSE